MLEQATLFREADLIAPPEADYGDVFRRLYYHLYSNSRASRAERIISDLSNLLLCIVYNSETLFLAILNSLRYWLKVRRIRSPQRPTYTNWNTD